MYQSALLESEGFPPKIFGGKKNLISATWRKFPPIDVDFRQVAEMAEIVN